MRFETLKLIGVSNWWRLNSQIVWFWISKINLYPDREYDKLGRYSLVPVSWIIIRSKLIWWKNRCLESWLYIWWACELQTSFFQTNSLRINLNHHQENRNNKWGEKFTKEVLKFLINWKHKIPKRKWRKLFSKVSWNIGIRWNGFIKVNVIDSSRKVNIYRRGYLSLIFRWTKR